MLGRSCCSSSGCRASRRQAEPTRTARSTAPSQQGGPLLHLRRALDAFDDLYFQPRSEQSVHGRNEGPRLAVVESIGYVTQPAAEAELPTDGWVTGIIIANPFHKVPDGPEPRPVPAAVQMLRDSEVVICDLRRHHPNDGRRYTYRLDGFEHAWTSDVMLCRAIADCERADPDPYGHGSTSSTYPSGSSRLSRPRRCAVPGRVLPAIPDRCQ